MSQMEDALMAKKKKALKKPKKLAGTKSLAGAGAGKVQFNPF